VDPEGHVVTKKEKKNANLKVRMHKKIYGTSGKDGRISSRHVFDGMLTG